MITWKSYSSETGENIEFCCDTIQSVYGPLVTWDPADKKWCIIVRRQTVQHNPYTSKNETIIEKDKFDLKTIDYCPFCGKNIYKEEMRYNTTGSGWNTYVCGKVF